MEQLISLDSQNRYEISVKGEIEACWSASFGGVEVQPEMISGGDSQSTLLKIVTDQAGLVGLIRRLHGLGVVIIAVQYTGPRE